MTKKVAIILIAIVVVCVCIFSGCNATKSIKVFPEDREVSGVTLVVYNSKSESVRYSFTSEEIEKLKTIFGNLGYIERQYISNPIISETFDYILEVNVEKKGLSKAYTYYVYIGREYSYSVNDTEIINQKESKYLKIKTNSKKYQGEANDEVINYLAFVEAAIL